MFGGAAGYRPRVRSAYSVRVYRHISRFREHYEHRRGWAQPQVLIWGDGSGAAKRRVNDLVWGRGEGQILGA